MIGGDCRTYDQKFVSGSPFGLVGSNESGVVTMDSFDD